MPRLARGEYIDPGEIQIVHGVQRCVRRAFLCGDDPLTGQSFEHRREWIRARQEFLASVFGIDCLTYAVLSNHLHVVLRSRPDVVETWSDEEVARRWLRLFPKSRKKDKSPAEPTGAQLNMIVNNEERLTEIRKRLSDVSWWMRCTSENIARQANKEDKCTGRFWEGRYKAQLILDEASLLACSAYVDLNPIRAAIADTPEKSTFTGAKDRIDDLKQRSENSATKSTYDWERSRRRAKSGWLSPIEIREASDEIGPDAEASGHETSSQENSGHENSGHENSGRRASRKGFLTISLSEYLALLDWTGRKIASDRKGKSKRGKIPSNLAPILDRLGMEETGWCKLVKNFGKLFKRAAGNALSLRNEATKRGQASMHAPGVSQFTESISS